MKAQGFIERTEEIAGWGVRITSFRLGDQYHAAVENTAVGARIARGSGVTREGAEADALEKAEHRLQRTRIVPPSAPRLDA